jgi:hypothetical protein
VTPRYIGLHSGLMGHAQKNPGPVSQYLVAVGLNPGL